SFIRWIIVDVRSDWGKPASLHVRAGSLLVTGRKNSNPIASPRKVPPQFVLLDGTADIRIDVIEAGHRVCFLQSKCTQAVVQVRRLQAGRLPVIVRSSMKEVA